LDGRSFACRSNLPPSYILATDRPTPLDDNVPVRPPGFGAMMPPPPRHFVEKRERERERERKRERERERERERKTKK
jgi:hypothetical protein